MIDRDRLANECESLRTSIDRTRLKLVELERRLEQATAAAAAPSAPSSSAPSYSSFLHHHNHTTPLNPSHLSHRDAHSNQFHTPVVPLTTVLQLQPLEMVESSTTTDTIVDGVGVKSSDLAKVSTTPHSHDTTAAGESHPHARLPPCLSIAGLKNYVRKFQGQHVQTLPVSGWKDLLLAFIAGFIGIAVPALLNFNMLHAAGKDNFILIIASFGASAVLLYGVPMSDFSQPRNVIGGHAISAAIGVAVRHLVFASDADSDQPSPYTGDFLDLEWLGCALAVSLSIIAMNLTKTTHPPGYELNEVTRYAMHARGSVEPPRRIFFSHLNPFLLCVASLSVVRLLFRRVW